jgi:elongator complex protein 3
MQKNFKIACKEILSQIREGLIKNRKELERSRKKIAKKLKLQTLPTNIQILKFVKKEERSKFSQLLLTKPMRTISGVTIIAVAPKPANCPGQCIYCPKGENAPQSYTGLEPVIQRAKNNKYNPFLQVQNRLSHYKLMGHPRDKVELIIVGGTFPALDKDYQEKFVKGLFDALNGEKSTSIEEAHRKNESAKVRCSGLTIETRPDFCKQEHINQMLKLGTTRVEIGVQSVYPEILERVNRIHSLEDVIEATRLAKDSCLKVTYHVMPSLPGVDFKRDLDQFKILFENPDFKPDSLKIYPTLVIKGTELYEMWKRGEYKPLSTQKTINLLVKTMRIIPKYCRVVRLERTIATQEIEAGVKLTNLREFVEKEAEKQGIKIQEIRYREAGHKLKKGIKIDPSHVKLLRFDYDASGGKEIFLSFEDIKNDILIGFLRLRIPFKPFRSEITSKSALIRELHVYGPLVPVGEFEEEAFQHKGFGKKLLEEAERIAKKEFNKNKITVISGTGVRPYYMQFGYFKDKAYMSKIL